MKDNTSPAPRQPLAAQILNHVSYTAAQIADGMAIPVSDRDDIEQQMLIEITKAAPKYDPSRGTFYTFCQAIVRNVGHNVRRARRRDRDADAISLDTPVATASGEEGATLLELIPDGRDHIGEAILRIDVRGILAGLTSEERRACELIMAGRTTREIPAILGISRSRFYRHTWPSIQRKFASAMGRA